MARATGPLFSFGASGKMGGAIVFTSWKGRPVVRRLVTPSNPKSAAQTGVRSMFGYLGQAWAPLTTANKATWNAQADSKAISPFNAYTGGNSNRWKSFKAPSKEFPAAEINSVGTGLTTNVVAGVGEVAIDAQLTGAVDNWTIMIFRSLTTAFATSKSNLVKVLTLDSTTLVAWTDSPLVPDTYYYNFRLGTDDGVLGPETGEQSAVVT